jgi:hypothetical protein
MSHKYQVGQQVKVLVDNPNYSGYEKGDVVTIVEIGPVIEFNPYGSYYRCIKEGSDHYMSIQEGYLEPVDLITIPLPTNGEQTQALLKELGMEEQMLRQIIMSMPFDQVKALYLERRDYEIDKIKSEK